MAYWPEVKISKDTYAWNSTVNLYQSRNVKRKFRGVIREKGARMVYYLMRMFFECWEYGSISEDATCQAIHGSLDAKLKWLCKYST